MKRVLVSQNEENKETDYLIVNGKLLTDENSVVKYGRIISKTDDWEEIYRDDYLEIRKNKNQLLLKSFYNDKDIVGRSIYYLYMVDDKFDNIDSILGYLEQDSQLINRTYDRERTHNIVEKIKNNNEIKRKLIKYAAITVAAVLLGYLLTRINL